MKGITLKPKAGFESDYFAFESSLELMTPTPPHADLFSAFGSTDFLVKQSIVPVVAWVPGASTIRCIGTGFIVSCTGYMITASHVLLDPQERGYGNVVRREGAVEMIDGVAMGVLMPINPATGMRGFKMMQFEQAWHWGEWVESPLIHERRKYEGLTDVAVCKLKEHQDGSAFQPLNLSLNRFVEGEQAYAIGYAEMPDIPVEHSQAGMRIPEFKWELYVSVGVVADVFPQNHISKDLPVPGPSFDFRARIPGKMSGGPIFGAQGAVVRGVVSRSFTGEKHAFGSMLGPTMRLPFPDQRSLKSIMDAGLDGIAVVHGQGL